MVRPIFFLHAVLYLYRTKSKRVQLWRMFSSFCIRQVVAMFRESYDWVEGMRMEPHHAHDHLYWPPGKFDYNGGWRKQGVKPLHWKDFVTRPWIGKRGNMDRNISRTQDGIDNAECMDGYAFVDAAPCSKEDTKYLNGLGDCKYEFKHDGSERGFNSILDLRRDKILNHLSVADFLGTRAFFPFRYENLNANGTAVFLKNIEEATGLKAKCDATTGKAQRRLIEHRDKPISKHKPLPEDFVRYMNKYVDWEVESLIGYHKRDV